MCGIGIHLANMGAELALLGPFFHPIVRRSNFLNPANGNMPGGIYQPTGVQFMIKMTQLICPCLSLIALPSSPDKVVPCVKYRGAVYIRRILDHPPIRVIVILQFLHDGQNRESASRYFHLILILRHEIFYRCSLIMDCSAILCMRGARIHQAGCNGCIGMGQAHATARTVYVRCQEISGAIRTERRQCLFMQSGSGNRFCIDGCYDRIRVRLISLSQN